MVVVGFRWIVIVLVVDIVDIKEYVSLYTVGNFLFYLLRLKVSLFLRCYVWDLVHPPK